MSSSDWSDLEMNLEDMKEDASIRIVKSSTAQFILTPKKPAENESLNKDISFKNSEPVLRLSTSYSPLAMEKVSSPIKYKLKTQRISLFDEVKSPKVNPNDINVRSYKFQEKVKAKIEKMTKVQEDLEKKHCPFRPQLLTNTKNRNFEEFLKEMKEFDINKDRKLIDLRMKKGNEVSGNRPPKICKNSEKIVKKKSMVQPVHQKLYAEGRIVKKISDKRSEVLSFSPTVNPKSHYLKRELTVDQILYNDAMRRYNKRSQSPSFIKEKFISQNSEQVLAEKFIKDFQNIVEYLYPTQKTEFCYTDFVTILCELSFIHNDIDDGFYNFEREMVEKAWRRIEVNKVVSKESILGFLLAVMNYEHSSADPEIKSLHREFIIFYECRHWFVINEKKKREQREQTFTPSQFSGYSFSPCEISRKSVGKVSGREGGKQKWKLIRRRSEKYESQKKHELILGPMYSENGDLSPEIN